MKQVTKDLLDMLTKAAKDNSAGKGFSDNAESFRILFEPPKGDNSIEGLIKTLDRQELETEWKQIHKEIEYVPHDKMKLAIENDLVAQIHRDMHYRYLGRIPRILAETGNKQSHANEPLGLIANIAERINNFNKLESSTNES